MSDHVTANFLQVATTFMAWAETKPVSGTNESRIALKLVAELYHSATSLPDCECGSETEGMRITDEQWHAIYKRFSLLPFNYYSIISHPMAIPPDNDRPVLGDLADDLADIYRDVAEGVALYNAGHIVEAIWEWRFSFQHHWGEHAAHAIYALHNYFMENPDQWNSSDPGDQT